MDTEPTPTPTTTQPAGNPSAAARPGNPFPVSAGRPFALLRREGRDVVEVLTCEVDTVETLADLPIPPGPGTATLALVPYRQVRERGFQAVDDGTPLISMDVTGRRTVPVSEALAALPSQAPELHDGGFDVEDAEYVAIVRSVLRDEIGRGEGSNFVIHRTYTAGITGDPLAAALAAFARLLRDERGAYWTFCVHTGERTYVGATPERHVSVDDGLIMMNPISGTYRHPEGGPDLDGLLAFLADPKETDELYMVLDEELKMMAAVADLGGQVVGPYLKEMSHLSHTEYLLAGRGSLDVRDVLRATMFAPTVVGSPIENACRVVARHECRGRAYYGGVLALLGTDDTGRQTLDAPIMIRYAEFDGSGRLRVPVGATLVRHSVPENEVAETYAKASGILAALGLVPGRPGTARTGFAADERVQAALAGRNAGLARFWLDARQPDAAPLAPELAGSSVLVVDAEDTFTAMLTHQLRALGFAVTLRSHTEDPPIDGYDLVVAGPGPGDPASRSDPKMRVLRRVISQALASGRPLLGICLGHQVLASMLGLPLVRKPVPYQGVRRTVDFFGRPERVGFYSTFAATAPYDEIQTSAGQVRFGRDRSTGEIHTVRGTTFAGVQFHPESVLTEHGVDLLRELVTPLLAAARPGPGPRPGTDLGLELVAEAPDGHDVLRRGGLGFDL